MVHGIGLVFGIHMIMRFSYCCHDNFPSPQLPEFVLCIQCMLFYVRFKISNIEYSFVSTRTSYMCDALQICDVYTRCEKYEKKEFQVA